MPVKRLTDSDPLSRPMCETEGGGVGSRQKEGEKLILNLSIWEQRHDGGGWIWCVRVIRGVSVV